MIYLEEDSLDLATEMWKAKSKRLREWFNIFKEKMYQIFILSQEKIITK